MTKPAGVPTNKAVNKVTSRAPTEAVKDQPKSRINTFTGTTIPSSAILLARVQSNSKQYDILVVGDSHQQNSGKGIYWKNRELAKLITDAHFSGTNSFSYYGLG